MGTTSHWLHKIVLIRMKQLFIAACFLVSVQIAVAESEDELPRCRIVVKKLEVKRKAFTTTVMVSLDLANKTQQEFHLDELLLAYALHRANLTGKDRVKYEFEPTYDIDGASFTHFTGDRLLRPGLTNSVTIELLTGKEGIVLVNRDLVVNESLHKYPTNLTCEVFGVLWQSPERLAEGRKEKFKKEMLLSGWGKVPVDWSGFPRK